MKARLLIVGLIITAVAFAQEPLYTPAFFVNSRMPGNYFYSNTAYQSPSWIKNSQQKLPVNEVSFFTPGNSLQLQFVNGVGGKWEASIIKQEIRGQDKQQEPQELTFHILIASKTTTKEALPAIVLDYDENKRSDPLPIAGHLKTLSHGQWLTITIPLQQFNNMAYRSASDIRRIGFVQNSRDGKQHELYIDDIELVPPGRTMKVTQSPIIANAKGYAKHVDLEWQPITDKAVKWVKIYRAVNGGNYSQVGIQRPSIHRYADYTGETGKQYQYKISLLDHQYQESGSSAPKAVQTIPMTDSALLTMVQEACFRYYWEGAESNSGLAKENIPGRQNMIATGASGFGIMALIVGTDRGFISRQQAIERFTKIVQFLEQTETFHGAFAHFVDGPTKKAEPFFGRRDNGGDLVETSFLMQGLLAARSYFNDNTPAERAIRQSITRIWQKVEWDWYKRFDNSKFLYWHWSPDQAWVINHRLIGWNETMVTYLLAIASPTHAIPASMYYTGWANQDSTGQQYRANWGGTTEGAHYSNGNTYFGLPLAVGVSNGGPLFFVHYSYLGYDPHQLTDKYTNYFDNNQRIALINYRYCTENPGRFAGYSDSCWGLTASDGPFDYSADEPVLRQDKGKIAPTGAISSFPYTPNESMKTLRNYYYQYGQFLWGEYGFRDAFSLAQNWCSEIYMGLNQAPMVVMIENYRTGLLWKLFMSNPEINQGLKKLAAENTKPSSHE